MLTLLGGAFLGRADSPVVTLQPYVLHDHVDSYWFSLSWLHGLSVDLSRQCPLLQMIGVRAIKAPDSESNSPAVAFVRKPDGEFERHFEPWSPYYSLSQLPEDGYLQLNQPHHFGGYVAVVALADSEAPCTIDQCKTLIKQYEQFALQQRRLFCAINQVSARTHLLDANGDLQPDELIFSVRAPAFANTLKALRGVRIVGNLVRMPFRELDRLEEAEHEHHFVWVASGLNLLGVWRSASDNPIVEDGGIQLHLSTLGFRDRETGKTDWDDVTLSFLDEKQWLDELRSQRSWF